MDVFKKRQGQFDAEFFRGKNHDTAQDGKIQIANCTSQKLADYKFKKMQQKFMPERMYQTFIDNHDLQESLPNLESKKVQIKKEFRSSIFNLKKRSAANFNTTTTNAASSVYGNTPVLRSL